MKFLLLVHVFAFSLFFSLSYGQKNAEPGKITNVGIEKILKNLEHVYDVRFSYAAGLLENKKAGLIATEGSLDEILGQLLSPYHLQFEKVNSDFYIIKLKEESAIEFQVMDAGSNSPLPYATLKIEGTSKGYVSDANGQFSIPVNEDLPNVELSFIGFEVLQFNLDSIRNNQVIFLNSKDEELNEVVITEYINKGILADENSGSITILPWQMEVLPGMAENDILLSIQMLPGIISTNESASGINIRGSKIDHTFYYFNDIPLYTPSHYFGTISSLIPSAVGGVDIYKDYIPVEHGNATAGLVLAQSRINRFDKFFSEGNINLTHADIYTSAPLQSAGSLSVGLRRSLNDYLLTPTYNAITDKLFEGSTTSLYQSTVTDGTFDYTSQLKFMDANIVWDIPISTKDSLQASYILSQSNLSFDSQDDEAINRTIQLNNSSNIGGSIKYSHSWSPTVSTSLMGSVSKYDLNYSLENIRNFEGDIDQFESRNNKVDNANIKLKNSLSLEDLGNIEIGYQYNRISTNIIYFSRDIYDDNSTETFEQSLMQDGSVNSAFLNYFKSFPKSAIQTGLRFNTYSFLNSLNVEGYLKYQYEIIPDLKFDLVLGRFHQHLTALSEDQFTLANTDELLWSLPGAGEGLNLVRNDQLVGGFLYDDRKFLVDIDMYHKRLSGLNASNISPILDPFFDAEEQITGVDIFIKRRFRFVDSWVSYGYQNSLANVPDLTISNIPSAQNVEHQFQSAIVYKIDALSLSLGYTFRSGLRYTSARGIQEVVENGISYFAVDYEQTNSGSLPDYHRLDFSIWYPFNMSGKHFNGQIGLALMNITDHDNFLSRRYRIELDEDDLPVILEQENLLFGFTPNLSIRFRIK